MPIGFRASSHVASQTTNSLALTAPTGTQSTDVLVAFILWDNEFGNTLTPPAGWTTIDTSATGVDLGVWCGWALGSVASLTFSFNGTVINEGAVAGYTGVDNTTPIADHALKIVVATSPLGTTAVTVPTNGWFVGGWSDFNGGTTAWSTPSGLTSREVFSAMGVFDSNGPDAGSITASSTPTPGSATRDAAQAVALNPAGGVVGGIGAFDASGLTPSLLPGLRRLVGSADPKQLVTSTHASALARPANDKVVVLWDGSLAIADYDGTNGHVYQVSYPNSLAPLTTSLQTTGGDNVSLAVLNGASSSDLWIASAGDVSGSTVALQHGSYSGGTWTWDSSTTVATQVQANTADVTVCWTGTWLIVAWWDGAGGSSNDQIRFSWTTTKAGTGGWSAAAKFDPTGTSTTIWQANLRHSAKLAASVMVYGGASKMHYAILKDSATDPSRANWTTMADVDAGFDDTLVQFGGPQVVIDEATGKIHVVRAVANSGGPTWFGVTYWLGTPDATPMVTPSITWNSRLIVDSNGTSSSPTDIAAGLDSTSKLWVFWTDATSAGNLKYATLVSPYTSATGAVTIPTAGTPRYPHVPSSLLSYVPLVYQTGTANPYQLVLDTSLGVTSPPTVGYSLFGDPDAWMIWRPAQVQYGGQTSQNLLASVSDTLQALSETPIRLLSLLRSPADTLQALSETLLANVTLPRAVTDTLQAISESPARALALVRSLSDNLTLLSESASRSAQSFLRTATDNLTALSETLTSKVTLPRVVSDTLQALSESATAGKILLRSVTDTLTSVTESVVRGLSLLRSPSDTLQAISESASRASQAFLRTASDTLQAISESAAASRIYLRTATDTLQALSEPSLTRALALLRVPADTLTAISETASRASQAFARVVADSLQAISETPAAGKILLRTAGDALASVTDAVARGLALRPQVSDTSTGISESPARSAQGFLRSALDTLQALSETVVAIFRPANGTVTAAAVTISCAPARGVSLLVTPLAGVTISITPQQF